MANERPRCFICDQQPVNIERVYNLPTRFVVECRRCGRYQITADLAVSIRQDPTDQALLPYLSAHLRQATERGEIVTVTTESYRSLAEGQMHTPVHRKIDRVLEYFGRQSKHPGVKVALVEQDVPLFDAVSHAEVNYYVGALAQRGFLQQSGPPDHYYIVTPEGWAQLTPIEPGGVPGTCFVAMAFDPTLDPVYDDGIKPAIEACGLTVVQVGKIQHNGIVTDLILGEIRRAQLVVADVTLQRQGVYFEAGFAIGLGRTVIWSCRDDDLRNVHFDTRQYSHVVWTNPTDLRAKLEARIRGTVPIPVRH